MIRACIKLFATTLGCLIFFCSSVYAANFKLTLTDPNVKTLLGTNEPLYVKIVYESEAPIRFLPSALFKGAKREVGAFQSSAGLHASGKGEALTWIAFDNPTRIDEIVVTAFDGEWNRLESQSVVTDSHWSGRGVAAPRSPATWVTELQKKERLKLDYMFDPAPKHPAVASDTIFVLALLSIPTYLYLQVRMLRRYRQRWRELATVPLITALPMVVYAFSVGIGFNLRLWPAFFMYFMLSACCYLMMLLVIKKIRG